MLIMVFNNRAGWNFDLIKLSIILAFLNDICIDFRTGSIEIILFIIFIFTHIIVLLIL